MIRRLSPRIAESLLVRVALCSLLPVKGVPERVCVYWWEGSKKTEGPSVEVLQGDKICSFVFSGSRSPHNTRTVTVTTLIFQDLSPVAGSGALLVPHNFHRGSQKKERHRHWVVVGQRKCSGIFLPQARTLGPRGRKQW